MTNDIFWVVLQGTPWALSSDPHDMDPKGPAAQLFGYVFSIAFNTAMRCGALWGTVYIISHAWSAAA